jgi:phosphoglycerol transferase MdoB-like AlkP superfamily enzyme
MVRIDSRRLDGWTTLWLGLAALWCLGLVAAGFLVTSYSSSNGPGLTLIQENGLKVLAILLIPFVGVVIVALALWRRRRLQIPGAGVLVWIVFGLLMLLVLLGALTIGPFIAPVAVFVVLAITRVNGQSSRPQLASR